MDLDLKDVLNKTTYKTTQNHKSQDCNQQGSWYMILLVVLQMDKKFSHFNILELTLRDNFQL
jgi:hypothetical protein